jgi:hypothetical protein
MVPLDAFSVGVSVSVHPASVLCELRVNREIRPDIHVEQ